MSDYLLNSSFSLSDEKILDDINNIFQKNDIWINGPFYPEERLGWVDFEKVINSSHKNCNSILNKIEFENISIRWDGRRIYRWNLLWKK